ncbi:TPA: type VI secretion system ATPase TssH [Burkholderia territorii]|uniref:type VI secretion system ATPase TssH n=1 Tax=Burkholderia territorii TaxID=1503055 RepID=UPI0011C6F0DC|nr:type VI secretion system ATPase TssH [Burkholderia territorii]TXG05970.1 type VI secretion system ATPase TssH [Burkholderia territorii]HDR8861574.1 type VI secretion system ATPase TssH [Burkholderia territorii]HDR8867677.1 type VI secretion system ATPase TssH [Burkholderia territorii]HDR8873959.1 type VI secretion system ATPase TssH [Burkholderia territorii]HDR8880123.1 type VI secretion system ATPase TssH [Burkholderia territorii]
MNRERIFNCLGRTTYAALVDAAALGRSRRHTFIDLDHWALCLLQRDQSDLVKLLAEWGHDVGEVKRRLEKALDTFAAGGESLQDISASLERSVGPAVIWSQVAVPSGKVRSGHLLLAWMDDDVTRRWLQQRIAQGIASATIDEIAKRYEELASGWPESTESPSQRDDELRADGAPSGDALAKWATCLTDQAARGELDPVVGRDDELRTVIDILSRRRQNNPILVGEAGVGKTAVVEALAQKIHAGAVPPGLLGAQVWALDLARLQAGAGVRGEFEQRLKAVMDAVLAAPNPVILFCDETHTLVGAGGAAGTGDAANLIKPMLARGQLRMVAATTWSEYKQYIEPDAALVRRFQAVPVEEPGDTVAVDMLRTIAPRFAEHHGVHIVDAALRSAVALSRRYLPARQLPDKAISLLDTACARVAMSQSCAPAELERLAQQAFAIGQTLSWRANDRRMGVPTPGDEADLEARRESLARQARTLEGVVETQREEVNAWLARMRETSAADVDGDGAMAARISADRRVRPWVDEHVIAEVLAEWTGVPVTQLAEDEAQRVVDLERLLGECIHGQAGGLRSIAHALHVSHSGLGDPQRPLGVMLLAGPTGTGKSQAAAKLAELLFGGDRNLVQFNMNEFQEAHTVSTLKGAPPGYVGYGKGGRLTEAIRKKPYSVLLLDEFDRAHRDVHEVFYQVFDQGWMEDGDGRRISFRNSLILLTTNLGDAEIEASCKADPEVSQAKLEALVRERLQGRFSAALLARIQVVVFRPLDLDALTGIAHQALDEIGERLAQTGLGWQVDDDVAGWIAQAVAQHPANGRAVRDMLRQYVMPTVARGVLAARAESRTLRTVRLSATDRLSLAFEDDEDTQEDAVAVPGVAEPVATDDSAESRDRDASIDAGSEGEPACV